MAEVFHEKHLSDRERQVLHFVINDFIETATPIGSKYMSKRHEDVLGLSSASIRIVMSDLEEMGYIDHPHTSAGRIPTDRGYRFYLDSLMHMEKLSEMEEETIRQNLDAVEKTDELFKESSRLLGKISRQLCVVTSPQLGRGAFEKMELVHISGNRVLVIISIKSGLVRTIMMETATEISREKLDELSQLLNERLTGLTLRQIRDSFRERVKDAQNEETGLIRLFVDSIDRLFVVDKTEKLHISGTENILTQPEFVNPSDVRDVIELINNEEVIIHVLEKIEAEPREIKVRIGNENEDEKLKPYSLITSIYTAGDVVGSVGVIGPKRMPYSRMIPLVDSVTRIISETFSQKA